MGAFSQAGSGAGIQSPATRAQANAPKRFARGSQLAVGLQVLTYIAWGAGGSYGVSHGASTIGSPMGKLMTGICCLGIVMNFIGIILGALSLPKPGVRKWPGILSLILGALPWILSIIVMLTMSHR